MFIQYYTKFKQKKIYVRTYGALKLIIYRLYPKNLKSSDKNFLSNCVLKNIRKNETILVKGSQILKKRLMALQAFDAIQFYLYRNRLQKPDKFSFFSSFFHNSVVQKFLAFTICLEIVVRKRLKLWQSNTWVRGQIHKCISCFY